MQQAPPAVTATLLCQAVPLVQRTMYVLLVCQAKCQAQMDNLGGNNFFYKYLARCANRQKS